MDWGSLGDYVFELVAAPAELRVTDAMEWAEMKRIGRKPLLQRSGEALQEMHLTLKLHRQVDPNPELTVRVLQDYRSQGMVLPLVIGKGDTGIYAQNVVIQRMEHRPLQYAGGRLIAVEIVVTLKEYVAPDELEISTRQQPKAIVKSGQKAEGPKVKTEVKTVNGFSAPEIEVAP